MHPAPPTARQTSRCGQPRLSSTASQCGAASEQAAAKSTGSFAANWTTSGRSSEVDSSAVDR